MVFIVKIPSRSHRTTPEGEEQQQQHEQVQRQGSMADGAASIPGQWGEESVSPPPAPVRMQEHTAVEQTEQPTLAASPLAPRPATQNESVPSQAPLIQNIQPTEQIARSTSIQDALDALSMLSIGTGGTLAQQTTELQSDREASPAALAYPALPAQEDQEQSEQAPAIRMIPSQPQVAPLLDVIVAPAVLAHRYIRGRDVSLIVERPERVRAVLLGVSALLGRMAEDSESRASCSSARTAAPGDDADDLISQLQGMSMAGQGGDVSPAASPQVHVLHSTKSVSLHPAHPALAVVHAHQEEMVDDILPECEEKRRRKGKPVEATYATSGRQDEKAAAPSTLYSSYVSQLCSYAPHTAPIPPQPAPRRTRDAISATATPTGLGRTRRATRQASPGPAPSMSTPTQMREGDAIAPSTQDIPAIKQEADVAGPMSESSGPQTPAEEKREPGNFALPPTTPAQKLDDPAKKEESSSSSSSSDDETDRHASEVPYHLSQGDLYLRGSKTKGLEDELAGYGSAEAIQHALAASIEAIDRVCACDSSSPSKPNGHLSTGSVLPLDFHSALGAASSPSLPLPPSRRAFVLTRPPGHHCSGSAPSGFCWVNNAAVAAVHAYQTHGVDRVVIFDIDLHHGNGTQKIAWRINEETRRGDLERAARIKAAASSLAGRSGSGRGRGPRKSGGGVGGGGTSVDVEAGIPPRGLQVFYSSLHDIESFPCEDGDADLVRDASVCIQGAHGQWIWNGE